MLRNDFCDLTNFFLTFSITVVLQKEVPEGVEIGQNALNKRCRAYPFKKKCNLFFNLFFKMYRKSTFCTAVEIYTVVLVKEVPEGVVNGQNA